MKKRTVLIIAIVALFALFASSVSASAASDRILAAAGTFPFESYHLVQIENGLKNMEDSGIEITDDAADTIIACMEQLRPYGEACGYDFDLLTQEERAAMLVILNNGAAAVGCSVAYANDRDDAWEIIVAGPNGEFLDFYTSASVVKQTGYDTTLIVAAAAALVLSVAAAVVIRKKGHAAA